MDDLPWGHSIITLEDRLQEIENLLSSKFYQAALALALTVPDICGKVEFPKKVFMIDIPNGSPCM